MLNVEKILSALETEAWERGEASCPDHRGIFVRVDSGAPTTGLIWLVGGVRASRAEAERLLHARFCVIN